MLNWNWLQALWFNLYEEGDGEEKFFFNIFGLIPIFIFFVTLGPLLDVLFFGTGTAILIAVSTGFIATQASFFAGRLHPLHGIDGDYLGHTSWYDNGNNPCGKSGYHSHRDFRELGEHYLELPKADRKELGPILKAFKNPDLSYAQKEALSCKTDDALRAITERNEARDALVVTPKVEAEISGILERLESAKMGAEVELEVYREYGDKELT